MRRPAHPPGDSPGPGLQHSFASSLACPVFASPYWPAPGSAEQSFHAFFRGGFALRLTLVKETKSGLACPRGVPRCQPSGRSRAQAESE